LSFVLFHVDLRGFHLVWNSWLFSFLLQWRILLIKLTQKLAVIVTLPDLIRFAIHRHINFWPLDWLVSLFEWFVWWLLGSMWNVHQLNFFRFFTLNWSFFFSRRIFLNVFFLVF
jgi:hypothetical protein